MWSKGYGVSDLEQNVPVTPEKTKFRIGSVAKPLTGFALGILIDSGEIQLDKDVLEYVPSFPKKKYSFTVKELAGHLSGIRHYHGNEAYSRIYYPTVLEGLSIFQNAPLVSEPGEKWSYTSYGFNLLSAVIEKASDTDFLTYMSENVFNPLGMHSTVADKLNNIIPNRGRYYYLKDGQYFNEKEVDNSYKWASGGYLSTTNDLVRFGLAHFNNDHLSQQTISKLWTEQKTNSGQGTEYGMGWRIVNDAEGNLWIGHGGGSIGGTSQLWLFPEQKVVIAVTSNLTQLNYHDLLPKLREVFIQYAENKFSNH